MSQQNTVAVGGVALAGVMSSAALALTKVGPGQLVLTSSAQETIRQLQDTDATLRMRAAQGAGLLGANVIPSIGPLLDNPTPGIAKAAELALMKIVHHAARPGTAKDANAVNDQLLQWVSNGASPKPQLLAIRLLQYTGNDKTVPALAGLLGNARLRQEALMTLERIPGRASTRAMESGLKNAPADFQPDLRQALNRRKAAIKTVGIKEEKR